MKKFIILCSLVFLPVSVYSACPVGQTDNFVCSLAEFRQQMNPIFKQTQSGIKTNVDNTQGALQPLNRTDPILQMRGPNNDVNYNTGCQFGVCLQNSNETRLPDNKGIGN